MKRCINMYDNTYKNQAETGSEELEALLQLLADLDRPITLYAIGGTAMVLQRIKEATKDIDFLTTLDPKQISELFSLAGLIEKSKGHPNIWYLDDIRIDVFYGNMIMGVELSDDWKEQSIPVRSIGKVRLSILDWYDIIITKIARAEDRDYEDCRKIIETQNVDIRRLKEKYYAIADTSLISEFDEKFRHLERLLAND